jgi:hypothetical protein
MKAYLKYFRIWIVLVVVCGGGALIALILRDGEIGYRASSVIPIWVLFVVPAVITAIYIATNLFPPIGRKDTKPDSYVDGTKSQVNTAEDVFLRKHVTTRVIPKAESSHGGGRGGASAGGKGIRSGSKRR